ncbi:hypothetical protein BKA81DRAFT_376845 [Phyllosticta paracitricarpa]
MFRIVHVASSSIVNLGQYAKSQAGSSRACAYDDHFALFGLEREMSKRCDETRSKSPSSHNDDCGSGHCRNTFGPSSVPVGHPAPRMEASASRTRYTCPSCWSSRTRHDTSNGSMQQSSRRRDFSTTLCIGASASGNGISPGATAVHVRSAAR